MKNIVSADQSVIRQNSDSISENLTDLNLESGKKFVMFDQRKPFMDEVVELSCKLKKRHIYGLRVLIAET